MASKRSDHGFCIEHGGIDNEADTPPGWRVVTDASGMATHVEIGPNAFFRDFRAGVDLFFEEVRTNPVHRATFLSRLQEVYPTKNRSPTLFSLTALPG